MIVLLPTDVSAADTTTATMGTFLMAMIKHPEVQSKAQAELDRVLGPDRLPTLSECVRYKNRSCLSHHLKGTIFQSRTTSVSRLCFQGSPTLASRSACGDTSSDY